MVAVSADSVLRRRDILVGLSGVAAGLLWVSPARSGTLDSDARRAFRKIGIGPEQAEPYAALYEEFLRNRNMQMRRVLNSRSGEEVPVMARKRARRAAKKSVKQMREVLTEQQLEYYEAYLEIETKIFLREAGLR